MSIQLKIASANDSKRLSDFFKGFSIQSPIEYKIHREQDYFDCYSCFGDQYKTYYLEKDGQILATASFVFRESLFEGDVATIGWATDLRVAPNREATLEWTKHFLPVLKEIIEEHRLTYVFSSINLTEPGALNTFVRPRPMRRHLPKYFLYRKYRQVSLHGQFPMAEKPLSHLTIESATPNQNDELVAYLKKRSQYRPFASVWDHQSFYQKIQRLKGFDWSNFLVAKDKQNKVIGTLALWDPTLVQKYIPVSYGIRGHNFRQALKVGQILGLSRKLTKPYSSSGSEENLDFQQCLLLHADNEDIFQSLLWRAWGQIKPTQFLTYSHVDEDIRLMPPKNWISYSHPYGLYVVLPPTANVPNFLLPNSQLNPEIESFL